MRAVIYARVSSDPTRELRSVSGQVQECQQFIEREGWTLVREAFVDNDKGASRHSRGVRSAHKECISFLESGEADVLVLWEGSRAQRDMRAYLDLRDLCERRGIRYAYNGRVYDLSRTDDRFSTALDALLAEREADVIRDRVHRGMRGGASAGRPHGRLLYGYRRAYDDRGGYIGQEEHPERGAIVREVFKAIDEGHLTYGIVKDLNARGVPNPTGRAWDLVAIRRLALNPAYIGKRVFRGEVVGDGDWPGLVDEDVWYRVGRILMNPRRRTQRGSALRYQLSGMRCGACERRTPQGNGVLRTVQTSRVRDRSLRTYYCKVCAGVACSVRVLDGFIDRVILHRLRQPDTERVFSVAADDGRVAALRAEEAKLRLRLDDHYAEAATGALSAAGLAAVERMLLGRIDAIEAELREVSTPSALRGLDREKLAAEWADTPVVERRRVIFALADLVLDPARVRGQRTFDQWRLARSRWVGDDRTWGEHWIAAGLSPTA